MALNYIARQDASWTVVSTTPDVCKTPIGPSVVPIPYPVTADMVSSVLTVPTVLANDCPVLVLNQSFIPTTKGDKAGVAKGIKSGTVEDICEPLESSTTVHVGGKPVLRHNDAFWMNARNTTGIILGQPPAASVPASQADPAVVPETAEEQSYINGLVNHYRKQAESQPDDEQAREAFKDFTTDHTPDGVMNSHDIGAML
jgi:hypothetical protein